MLDVKELCASYSGLRALHGVSFNVKNGEFISILGPNGAGKTTLLKCLSGTVTAEAGSATWGGTDLLAIPAARRPAIGLVHVPEGRLVFPTLSVADNILVAANSPAARAAWERSLELIWHLFPALFGKRTQLAGTLSGGQQQMLAIARGLAAVPTLLMLDEPSMGLAPAIADSIFSAIAQIRRERGLTILLVEQRAADAIELCDRAYVLESGRISEAGGNGFRLSKEEFRRTYFGMHESRTEV